MEKTTNSSITYKEYWEYIESIAFLFTKYMIKNYPLDELIPTIESGAKKHLSSLVLDYAIDCEFLENKNNYKKILSITNNFPSVKDLKSFKLDKENNPPRLLSIIVLVGDIVDRVSKMINKCHK